jgi:hypothetical protein
MLGTLLIAGAFFIGASGISDFQDADRLSSASGAYGTGDYNVAVYNDNTSTTVMIMPPSTTPTTAGDPTTSTTAAAPSTSTPSPHTAGASPVTATRPAQAASRLTTTTLATAPDETQGTLKQASSADPEADGPPNELASGPVTKSKDKERSGTMKVIAALAVVTIVAAGSAMSARRSRSHP